MYRALTWERAKGPIVSVIGIVCRLGSLCNPYMTQYQFHLPFSFPFDSPLFVLFKDLELGGVRGFGSQLQRRQPYE